MEEIKTTITLPEKAITLSAIGIVATIASYVIGPKLIPITILTCLVYYLMTGDRPTFIYAQCCTLTRDFTILLMVLKISILLKYYEKTNSTVADILGSVVKKYRKKVAIRMDDKTMTYQEVEELSDKIAECFHRDNYKKGDTVALLMENRLEYFSILYGLSKIGTVTALINTNLKKDTLIHSIKVANSKAIIVSPEYLDVIKEVLYDEDIKKLKIFVYRSYKDEDKVSIDSNMINLVDKLDYVSLNNLTFGSSKISIKDKFIYIYTSGTTGMPKAAIITHIRFLFIAFGAYYGVGMNKDDIIYTTLPLYHAAGCCLGVAASLLNGLTVVLRKKFSASNFWTDCIKYNCTVANYIGEICRFLYTVPPKPTDTQHKLRLLFGNGLRPQLWPDFVKRFKVPKIAEIYGATEGNSNVINFVNKVGSVGFVPRIFKRLYPATLIRCNEITGEPLRNVNGRCIESSPGQPGVFINRISLRNAVRGFSGYADKKASEKKILRDVFKQGDAYFNSGDILVQDVFGFFYFKDRAGDTFRWRGENVATTEVESIIMKVVGLNDCTVYGVEIPNTEGKAGMAAIMDPDEKLDLVKLAAGLKDGLPAYARPVFIRVLKELPMTGTFKLKKTDLQTDGYDLTKINEPIYLLQRDGSYKRFTQEDFEKVKNGTAGL